MPPGSTASCCLFVIVIVARAVTTDGTRAPPGNQLTTTSRDGCRIQPADRGVGVNVDCSDLRLGYIPNDLPTDMHRLTMRRNNITRLNDYSLEKYTQLTSLDLSRNELRALDVHAFSGMSRLEQLDLTYNKLCLNNKTYPVGLFSGMTSLWRLTMTSNICNTRHTEYPAETLAQLSNLEYISLTGIPTSQLGEGFGQLTNLKSLVFAGQGCNMPVVRNMTFSNLRNVTLSHLCIKACRLRTMEAGALKPLPHLKTLNLACNQEVGFFQVYTAIKTATSMKLKTLVLDDVDPVAVALAKEHFEHNAFTDVERLSIRANYIMSVDVRICRPLKNLTDFNIGYNTITSMQPKVNSSEALFTTLFSLHLDVIDVSYVFGNISTYRRRYCFREAMSEEEDPPDPTEYFFRGRPPYDDLDYSRPRPPTKPLVSEMTKQEEKERLTIPPSIQIIYADNIGLKSSRTSTAALNVTRDNDVVVMNVSGNPQFTAVGPFHGLRRCQVVDLRRCAIEYISPGALSDMPMLKYLFLMDNKIGKKATNLRGTFDGLPSLEVLDLSSNNISQIHASAFAGLTNLRTLSLRGNQLTSVSFDISGLRHLTTINLADNNINYIDPKFLADTKRMHIDVDVELRGNQRNTHHPWLVVGVIASCVVAVVISVGLVAVAVGRRGQRFRGVRRLLQRCEDDDELLQPIGPADLLDDMEPDLPAEQPCPSADLEE